MLLNNYSQVIKLIMVGLAVVMGLYFILLAPAQLDLTQDTLIMKQTKQGENFGIGASSRLYIGTMLRGLIVMAGVTLLALAYPLYKGRRWAWPISLLCLSVAPIGTFYVGLGFFENIKKFPPAWIVFIIGLLAFWAMLLLKENDRKTKISLFVIVTLVGMLGTQAFTLFPHAVRVIMGNKVAAITEPASMILRHSGPIMLIIIFLAFISIPLLLLRKEAGWWLALLSGLGMAVASFPVHFVRPTASLVPEGTFEVSIFTSTYFMAGVQGVILTGLLLLPYFKSSLIEDEEQKHTLEIAKS